MARTREPALLPPLMDTYSRVLHAERQLQLAMLTIVQVKEHLREANYQVDQESRLKKSA